MARPNPPRTIGREDNLAERVAAERNHRGWSYDALAKRMTEAGCPIQGSALYKIEKGEPRRRITVDELVALSQVFEIEVADLLTPIELVRKQRAQELLAQVEPATDALTEAGNQLLELWTGILELAADDYDLYEYVQGHMFRSDPEGEGGPLLLVNDEVADDDFDLTAFETAVQDFILATINLAGDVVEASLDTDTEGQS